MSVEKYPSHAVTGRGGCGKEQVQSGSVHGGLGWALAKGSGCHTADSDPSSVMGWLREIQLERKIGCWETVWSWWGGMM